MALNSTVRWYLSTMPGAPEIRDQPGGIIGVLDACLVDGFASETVNTLTVVSGVATVNISGGHDYEKHAVIRIAGADPATLNGDWRVATVPDGSNLTFACPGIADVAATGTITAIRATPGYWEKAYSDTHKGAYRSTHEDATGLYLRVDDSPTGINSSPVRGYETMTGIDTGANPFPTEAQAASFVWRRTDTTVAGSLPRPWALVADEAWFCLIHDAWSSADIFAALYQFGDAVRSASADAYACYVTAHATALPTSPSGSSSQSNFAGVVTGQFWARNQLNQIGPVGMLRYGNRITSEPGHGEPYPAPLSGGYLFHHPSVLHQAGGNVRGLQPAFWQGLTDQTTLAADPWRILEADAQLPTTLLLYSVGREGGVFGSYIGLDIWGPWR